MVSTIPLGLPEFLILLHRLDRTLGRFRLAGIANPPVPVVKAGDWKGFGDRGTEGKPRPCANQTEGEKSS